MASLFDTQTLGPLLQLTTTEVPLITDLSLEPAVKTLLENGMVTETMETVWQAGVDVGNGTWLGQVKAQTTSKPLM